MRPQPDTRPVLDSLPQSHGLGTAALRAAARARAGVAFLVSPADGRRSQGHAPGLSPGCDARGESGADGFLLPARVGVEVGIAGAGSARRASALVVLGEPLGFPVRRLAVFRQ